MVGMTSSQTAADKKSGNLRKSFFYSYFFGLKCYVFDSLLLHLPPLRIHCVGVNPELLRLWHSLTNSIT